MMKILINRFHGQSPESFLKLLPQENAKAILSLDTKGQDISSCFSEAEDFFKNSHYSWLVPAIKKFPKGFQSLLLTVLPTTASAYLEKNLGLQQNPYSPIPQIRLYLLNYLYKQIKEPQILPLQLLPETPFISLIELGKQKIEEVIDFLGIYDLAEEIRHIVDQKTLKMVYKCLSPQKQQFLRMCLHQQEKLAVSKLELAKWQGDCTKLEILLHRRGLLRLGKALCGQHPDFMWYMTHSLDTGRSSFLMQYYKKEKIPGITSILTQHVLNVINFLKKKSLA